MEDKITLPILVREPERLEDIIKDIEFGIEMANSNINYVNVPRYLGGIAQLYGITQKQMMYNWYAMQVIKEMNEK